MTAFAEKLPVPVALAYWTDQPVSGRTTPGVEELDVVVLVRRARVAAASVDLADHDVRARRRSGRHRAGEQAREDCGGKQEPQDGLTQGVSPSSPWVSGGTACDRVPRLERHVYFGHELDTWSLIDLSVNFD